MTTENNIVTRQDDAPLVRRIDDPGSIMAILSQAVEKGTDPATLERLMALSERIAANAARQQFNEAMAHFKATCPPVARRTENSQFKVTRNGTTQNRRYAALEDIEKTIRGPLGDCGLSFRWGDAEVNENRLRVTCVVSHVGGHSESSAVILPLDSKAGCSDQQKFGSAMTYAQRYSLIQALGLTSCEDDADGADPAPQTITENQLANMQALIDEVKANVPKLLEYLGVERLADCPAHRYSAAVQLLEKKRGGK